MCEHYNSYDAEADVKKTQKQLERAKDRVYQLELQIENLTKYVGEQRAIEEAESIVKGY